MYTVYLITNNINRRQYVGQTKNFKKRQLNWRCLKYPYANCFLTEERAKYGLDSFKTEVLAQVETEEEALELEEHYIKELNTLYPQGYNIDVGGKNNCGAPKGENNPMYGRNHTEETKRKMSEAKKGVFNTKTSKPLLQLDKDTGEVIREWPSTTEVERQLGYSQANISKCCLGKRKSANGFKWIYKKVS